MTISPGAGARRASAGTAVVVAVAVVLEEPPSLPQPASAAQAMSRKKRQTVLDRTAQHYILVHG
jgi:hypothetical protein